jgi:quercetin dioxygenase-like cupin family protein
MNTSHRITALILAVGMGLMAWSLAQAQEAGHILLKSADIKWTKAPPSMPPGTQIAVLEGDLNKAEPFTMRLKLPADSKLGAHTHSTVEHVTVLSGSLYMGAGDQLDRDQAVALPSGSFAVFQPGHSMFAWADEETVIQVHGVGPWGIHYLHSPDNPSKQ